MPTTFSSIPEEIVERILSLVFTHHLPPAAPRPAWLQYPSTPHTVGIPRPPPSKSHHPRLSPLLVSRTWLRIATPLYYRNLSLHTPNQATSLAALLSSNPHLAKCIRSLSLHATFPSFQLISSLCPNIDELHLTVDNGAKPPTQPDGVSDDLRAFCQGISNITDLKHLTLRKNAYLTLPGPCLIFDHLTNALARWQSLESVNVAFRSSHTSALSAFASALSRAPKLHSIHAVLPSVWNDALLEMSSNPALKSISLQETPQQPYAATSSQYTPYPRSSSQYTPYPRSSSQGFFPRQPTITSSHLFLAEARKHPKLMELIKLGTPMVRARANTVALPFPTRPQIQVQPAANMEVEPEVQPVAGPSSNSLIPPSGAGSRQGKKGKRRQTNNNGETSVSRPTARRLSAV